MCESCKKLHQLLGKDPRAVITLPAEITDHEIFAHRDISVRICEYCDGDVLEFAMSNHRARMAA